MYHSPHLRVHPHVLSWPLKGGCVARRFGSGRREWAFLLAWGKTSPLKLSRYVCVESRPLAERHPPFPPTAQALRVRASVFQLSAHHHVRVGGCTFVSGWARWASTAADCWSRPNPPRAPGSSLKRTVAAPRYCSSFRLPARDSVYPVQVPATCCTLLTTQRHTILGESFAIALVQTEFGPA